MTTCQSNVGRPGGFDPQCAASRIASPKQYPQPFIAAEEIPRHMRLYIISKT
jgi:hypothetical protein